MVGRRRTIVGVMIFDAIMFGATGFSRDVTTILILRTLAGLAAPVALGISYVAALNRELPPARAGRRRAPARPSCHAACAHAPNGGPLTC